MLCIICIKLIPLVGLEGLLVPVALEVDVIGSALTRAERLLPVLLVVKELIELEVGNTSLVASTYKNSTFFFDQIKIAQAKEFTMSRI